MESSRIYIIDDNEFICDALKFLFDSFCSLNVKTYQSPLQFLEELSPEWEGCIITDLFMQSMSGIELTKTIKQINNNLHILIMSGHGTSKTAAQALEAGANDFLLKPFKTEYLLEKVTTLLKLKPVNTK